MPSKHIEKIYAEDAYYHVFNRGVNRQNIFKDATDYEVFINLLKRHISPKPVKDKQGREYPSYYGQIKLLAFCLMPNHYHLLVLQSDKNAMTKLLKSVCTAYTMYFNKKYKGVGHLFQDRFKASMVSHDAYLEHISRYIHLNPENYQTWEFSSLPYYLGQKQADWIDPQPILDIFEGESYSKFLSDYAGHRKMLKDIKSELADM
jgi:REP element-mobilizing transposase RayT